MDVMEGQVVKQVGVMVGQIVEHHLTRCHLVFITIKRHSHLASTILRRLNENGDGVVLVEAGSVFSLDQLTQKHLLKRLWGGTKTSCRGLILDLSDTNRTGVVLSLVEASGLWKLSETVVVVVGERSSVKEVLLHHSFRNTVNALYLALHDPQSYRPSRLGKSLSLKASSVPGSVWLYRRCLYCNSGDADVQLVEQLYPALFIQLPNNLFAEQLQNFMGHQIKFIVMRFFPYSDFKLLTDQSGSPISFTDCLDARLASVISSVVNCRRSLVGTDGECCSVGCSRVAVSAGMALVDRRSVSEAQHRSLIQLGNHPEPTTDQPVHQ
ncbi:hypothetical protein OTU49_000866 [Cherax quadricarinatus]|uniref:Uncharacterized protein n=1 Tax=Cherax quadricarinatus TaxID=27406 RepID=A0AAW0XYK4_CHEQU